MQNTGANRETTLQPSLETIPKDRHFNILFVQFVARETNLSGGRLKSFIKIYPLKVSCTKRGNATNGTETNSSSRRAASELRGLNTPDDDDELQEHDVICVSEQKLFIALGAVKNVLFRSFK